MRIILLFIVVFMMGCNPPIKSPPMTEMPPIQLPPKTTTDDNIIEHDGYVWTPQIVPKHRYVDSVVVEKSRNKMYLMKNNSVVQEYDIALGKNPVGHKVKEGDYRTPEGRYMLTFKNDQSRFYKSIRIDYPNQNDKLVAWARDVSPGGDIVIHGMPNKLGNYRGDMKPRNWTQGCIAVRNHEMDEIWSLVESDTPIEIRP
jgi:murein L,D-transpeptidase YafK